MAVSEDGLYTYPDVVMMCGEPKYTGKRKETLLTPTSLIEVLSPSTEAEDRGFKSAQYRRIESLKEYALVSQDEPRVEVFRRQDGGHWLLSEFAGLESVAHFESVGLRIPFSEIYAKVIFGPDEPLHPADQ